MTTTSTQLDAIIAQLDVINARMDAILNKRGLKLYQLSRLTKAKHAEWVALHQQSRELASQAATILKSANFSSGTGHCGSGS